MFWKEVKGLIIRELLLEWKQKYAINGLLLYVASMVFVISLASLKQMSPLGWNVTFWIMMLFVAINAVAKSFMSDSYGQGLYLYTLTGPHALIAAKLIYNTVLLILVGLFTLLLYSALSPNTLEDLGMYVLLMILSCVGFAANLTLISAIASRAQNKATLMAVLSFPLTVPLMLTAIRSCRNAMQGLDRSVHTDELVFLGGFIVIISLVSFILFPFLWKEG